MTLTEIKTFAEANIKEHLSADWTFVFNNRKTAFGVCNYRDHTIALSKVSADNETDDAVEQTILHEIAHAMCGRGHGHGATWKQTARAIGVRNPRATRHTTSTVAPAYTYVIKFKDEVVQGYYKRPSRKRLAGLEFLYVSGRKKETMGHLYLEQC